jgi:hypothetical protein
MKILIQGLGEVPATVEFALEKEKPDVTYILCSRYEMRNISKDAGYNKPSQTVIEQAAKRTKTRVEWVLCDIFNIEAISDTLFQIFKKIKRKDQVLVNYTGGAASVKLLLGMCAILLSKKLPIKIIYVLRYKAGTEIYLNQTEYLKEFLDRFQKF